MDNTIQFKMHTTSKKSMLVKKTPLSNAVKNHIDIKNMFANIKNSKSSCGSCRGTF